MKRLLSFMAALSLCSGLASTRVSAEDGNATSLGYHAGTQIIPRPEEICPGTTFLQNDDESFENGYCWRYGGCVPPNYGAWAECYDADYVCGIQLMLTQVGNFSGQSIDIYVWDYDADGNPPPGPDPGNVLYMISGLIPDPPALWPEISQHNYQVCTFTNGPHFVGYWGNWPSGSCAFFTAADENGFGIGCPRTRVTAGSAYGTGWVPVNLAFPNCLDLGIREYAGMGDCQPTPNRSTNWGMIKALY
ncbi:MAG: hypothetical protein KJ970_07800 [Candidatus Eisenbacteria bacterium]|uniref:Secreted protein n=1 Tax=Eiseniibacteriota bacterium TaxID=2212470 RepID=A0A948W5U7_UNCEI|nr:hypothetical protein [Candidatus Eisenbacteria bacterium]MBU1948055.1 hypothetical protein [Candidatus Eisenbacteria bacterium]MBU2690819.1 hypothetical protein [Candidatus Eisenbacteria bacterium]